FQSQEIKDKIVNLPVELARYIQSINWSNNERNYDISVRIEIILDNVKPTSHEDRYDGSFIFSGSTEYQAADNRWTFPYMAGQSLNYSGNFNPLTAMVEFYMNIMLGYELDKHSKLGGQSFFEKANDVIQQSKFSEFFQTGWKERQYRIDNLLSNENQALRELEYFFTQAHNRLRVDERNTAGQYLRVIVLKLQDINPENEGLERFYGLHAYDLARLLSTMGFRAELEQLLLLNPQNEATYREFLE
ncbi:DUF4835 family protein, partial [bacterium]|nr:DUF4835 family protein [bacterium]